MNIITIQGHLGADAETRFTPNGKKVTNLRMAVNQRHKGEDVTTWYSVAMWGEQYDGILSYLKKGKALSIVGELLPPELYTGRDGQSAVRLEVRASIVQFPSIGRGQQEQGQQPAMAAAPSAVASEPVSDDDLPF